MNQTEWLPCKNWMSEGAEATLVTLILESGRISRHSHVLEIGCGLGRLSGEIARASGARVLATEASHIDLEKARAIEPDVGFMQGSGLSIPFQETLFDVVIIHQTDLHLSALSKVLSGMARILNADGRLLILAETRQQTLGRITSRYFPSLAAADALQCPDAAELAVHAADAGFVACGARVFGNGCISMDQTFLRQVRRFGHSMIHRIGCLEYAEGLMRLEEDYYGHPYGHHHAGNTLIVLAKEAEACLPLSKTA